MNPPGLSASRPGPAGACFAVAIAEDEALRGCNLIAVEEPGWLEGMKTCPAASFNCDNKAKAFMEQHKNLHASIPPALLAEAKRMAAAKHISVDELMEDAVGRIIGEFQPEKPEPSGKPFWKSFTEEIHALPEEVFERFPKDGASEHDHYLYGTPKRKA